jgi:hypothetical protein
MDSLELKDDFLLYDPAFRRKARTALSEFDEALDDLMDGTPAERARLSQATANLMTILAGTMIRLE